MLYLTQLTLKYDETDAYIVMHSNLTEDILKQLTYFIESLDNHPLFT